MRKKKIKAIISKWPKSRQFLLLPFNQTLLLLLTLLSHYYRIVLGSLSSTDSEELARLAKIASIL